VAQPKARQTQDRYAQRGKALSSSVQRLRGWVGSDPSRAVELADALVELNAHRLLGHGYAVAATDAQDAVRRAGELLAARGPIGPYTSIIDAARYVTAVVQLATIQVGLGLPDAAGQTMESLRDLREQLRDLRVDERLAPQTAIWACCSSGRSALAAGEIASANAYADAAVARLAESELGNDPDAAYLAMDVDRLASDCRWAAARPDEALSFLYAAKSRYDDVVAGRLDEPARHSPALVERLAEPLFGLYRDMADRLFACSQGDLSLVTRRRLIELLRGLAGRLGDAAQAQLASALRDLARDLVALGRVEEAEAARTEADAVLPDGSDSAIENLTRGVVGRGTQTITWPPLGPDASYAATTASAARTKIVDLAALQAEWQRKMTAWLESERPEARRLELQQMEHARSAAERRASELVEAERAEDERLAAEDAQAELAARLEAQQRALAEEAERLERKQRREERLEAHRLEVERREAERRAAQEQAVDPAEAERLELERLQAEIDELERVEQQAQAEELKIQQLAREQEPPPSAG
jgi:hypothetical protein